MQHDPRLFHVVHVTAEMAPHAKASTTLKLNPACATHICFPLSSALTSRVCQSTFASLKIELKSPKQPSTVNWCFC